MLPSTDNYTKLVLLGILVFYLLSLFFYHRWDTNIIGGGDSWGYNAYLPAAFIHHDLDSLQRTNNARRNYHDGMGGAIANPFGIDCATHIGEGKQILRYTMGVAIMQAPFFLVGHFYSVVTGGPQDGYAFPYVFAVHLATIVYVFWGLLLLNAVLRDFFERPTRLFILATLTLATNLYYFTIYSGPMAHGYLFSCYCLLIFATHRFYQAPKLKWALAIAGSAGLITLIRPVELISLAIPLLYGIDSWQAFKTRFSFWKKHIWLIVAAVILYTLIGVPQFVYWKAISGDFLFYSYGDEGFDFANPQIWKGLTSYTNGWLIYTPVMALALVGLIFLTKNRTWLVPVLIFLPIHIYITYSWWCWYYINGLGSRPMVETYVILAFPLGYTIEFLLKRKWTKVAWIFLLCFFASLNIFQTYQHYKGILWSEATNRAYFWSIFGKLERNYNDLVAFDSNEKQPTQVDFVKSLYEYGYEDSTDQFVVSRVKHSGQFSYKLTTEKVYAPGFNSSIAESGVKPGQWIRFSAWAYKELKEPSWWSMPVLVVTFERDGSILKYRHVRIDTKLGNPRYSIWGGKSGVWGEVSFYVKVPKGLKPTDRLKAFVSNGSGRPVYLDDLQVEVWE